MNVYKATGTSSPVYSHNFLNSNHNRAGFDHAFFILAFIFFAYVEFTTEYQPLPASMAVDPFLSLSQGEPIYTLYHLLSRSLLGIALTVLGGFAIRDYVVWRQDLVSKDDLFDLERFTSSLDFSALPNPGFPRPLEEMTNVELSAWCKELTRQVAGAESMYFDYPRRCVVKHMQERIDNKIGKANGGFGYYTTYVFDEDRQRPGDKFFPDPKSAY